ncbi:MAG: hypothetical protein ACI35Z_03275 [Sphingobacterium hotanense]
MKSSLFNAKFFTLIFLLLFLSGFASAYVKDTVHHDTTALVEKKTRQLKKASFTLVPSNFVTQFAGSIGLISVGAGWNYGRKDQWGTEFMAGIVPRYDTDRAKVTLTLRQTYTPWSISLNERFAYQPLRTGLYINTMIGDQFWFDAPEKYPSNYYTFSTKLRFNAFIGQEIEYKIPSFNSYFEGIKFFYDIHTNDLMLISRIQNSYLKAQDYLGLSLGLKLQIRRR